MGGTDLRGNDERPCLTLPAPVVLADVPALCDRAERLLKEGPGAPLECDVADLPRPDLRTVEALARVDLTARRLGAGIRLRGASVELLDLLALCGLPLESIVEAERKAEEREEPGGVQEERDPGNPAA